jgi:2-dehydro-3-deoxy-D-arabinonate dehydratase
MQVGKLKHTNGTDRVGVVQGDTVWLAPAATTISNILFADDPMKAAKGVVGTARESLLRNSAHWLAPIDDQEVWAAGVTYIRSKQARMDESPAAASVYDRVYSAERPELFFKATANRVVGPNVAVRVRSDSKWSVPEGMRRCSRERRPSRR